MDPFCTSSLNSSAAAASRPPAPTASTYHPALINSALSGVRLHPNHLDLLGYQLQAAAIQQHLAAAAAAGHWFHYLPAPMTCAASSASGAEDSGCKTPAIRYSIAQLLGQSPPPPPMPAPIHTAPALPPPLLQPVDSSSPDEQSGKIDFENIFHFESINYRLFILHLI